MKLQLLITADSPAELIRIASLLEPQTGVSGQTPAPAPATEVVLQPNQHIVSASVPEGFINPFAPPVVNAAPAASLPPVVSPVTTLPTPNVPPVTAVTAPVSPVATPVAAAVSTTSGGAVELDPRGFPWDGRIHSENRGRLKKGNFWKYARNMDPEIIKRVEEELYAQGYGRGPQAGAIVESDAAPVAAPSAPAGLPAGPAALPGLPEVTGPTAQSTTERFTKYMADPTKPDIGEDGLPGGKVKWVKTIINHFGAATMPELIDLPKEKILEINAFLDTQGL